MSVWLLCFLYSFIGSVFYYHNKKMGDWWTGVFAAIFWPFVVVLWLFGAMLVWMEDRELKRLVRRDIYDEDWWV